MPFKLWTRMCPRKHVLDEAQIPHAIAKGQLLGERTCLVCLTTLPWAVQKWLNRSICCRLGCDSGGPKEAQVQLYSPGGVNVPTWKGTFAPASEYDWTLRLLRRCGLMTNYFEHLLCCCCCCMDQWTAFSDFETNILAIVIWGFSSTPVNFQLCVVDEVGFPSVIELRSRYILYSLIAFSRYLCLYRRSDTRRIWCRSEANSTVAQYPRLLQTVTVPVRVFCFLVMAALWNRAGHYIFALWFPFLSSFFLSSPNLSRRRLDVCHTCTHGVASVRI